MSALTVDPVVRIALRVGLSLLFLWAASHKLRDVVAFRVALRDYDLLPHRCEGPFAVLLIASECGVAAGFWMPGLDAAAAIAAAGLLALYAGAIIINLARGRRHIDCGCAGPAGHQPLSAGLAVRNALLGAAALVSAVPAASRTLTWMDSVTIVAAVATLVLLYAAVDGLLAHVPRIAQLAGDHA